MPLLPDHLSDITATHNWLALWPEMTLGVLALLLLVMDLLGPAFRRMIPALTMGVQGILLVVLGWSFSQFGLEAEGVSFFDGALVQNGTTLFMRLFFLGCSIVICHLGYVYLKRRTLARVEFYHLLLVVTGAFMILAQSGNFFVLFVALETLSVGVYVMVAYARNSRFSLEAGLKYLLMSGFSSGILLFGIVLLYGAASNPLLAGTATDPFSFVQIRAFLEAGDDMATNAGNLLAITGAILVLAGVCFKIGAVPFQIWIPDVYQGAPTPTTALLAVVSKAGGFFVLYVLLSGPFLPLREVLVPLLGVVTIATLLFGNFAALGQHNVKRLVGMSGVSHAGFLLVGVLASLSVPWAFPAVLFYLVVYALSSFAVFEVMVHVAPDEDAEQEMELYHGLMQRQPVLGSVLAVGLGSLAGIPPLAGFITKFFVLWAALEAGLHTLVFVALLGVVLSIYYYFGWLRAAVFRGFRNEEATAEQTVMSPGVPSRGLMIGLSVLVVLLGLYPGLLPLLP